MPFAQTSSPRTSFKLAIANLKEVLGEEVWAKGKYEKAVEIFEKMSISPVCEEFLTLPAYEEIVSS